MEEIHDQLAKIFRQGMIYRLVDCYDLHFAEPYQFFEELQHQADPRFGGIFHLGLWCEPVNTSNSETTTQSHTERRETSMQE